MGGGASRLIADSSQLPRLQVAEQQAKVKQVDAEQAELQQQADLVQSTLQPLLAEREKLCLLAQAAADEISPSDLLQ